uniref:Uncharacterized protein n=1 Tax=viral metagenome TaxID=1070528 RepID=A0A6C0EP23_9ZZZZ
MAAETKVIAVQKPTDASMYITKKRMVATQVFFQDGTSVGTLTKQTDRPVYNNASVSYKKATGKPVDASIYTAYRGHNGIDKDLPYRAGGKKELPCVNPRTSGNWRYSSASSVTKSKVSCPAERGDDISDIKFVDNTISLSAMHPRMVGCCDHKIEDPNHTHSPGIQVDVNNQPYALGKPFFMANPPLPQGPNVSDHKVGGYLGPRSGYVENKHGYVKPSRETPRAPGGQGQEPAHLKINKPTLFSIKSS